MLRQRRSVLQSNEKMGNTGISLKDTINKASKWLRQFIIMLVVVYGIFTIITNLIQLNQVGGAIFISLGLFTIIICSLIYVARLVKKVDKKLNGLVSRKVLFDSEQLQA